MASMNPAKHILESSPGIDNPPEMVKYGILIANLWIHFCVSKITILGYYAKASAWLSTNVGPGALGGKHMSAVDQAKILETAVIEDTSLIAFYRDMNTPERRTFWACAAGWALDGMDFMIYPLVVGTIITMWKVDAGYAGLAGAVMLLSSAVGGWLGDRKS